MYSNFRRDSLSRPLTIGLRGRTEVARPRGLSETPAMRDKLFPRSSYPCQLAACFERFVANPQRKPENATVLRNFFRRASSRGAAKERP